MYISPRPNPRSPSRNGSADGLRSTSNNSQRIKAVQMRKEALFAKRQQELKSRLQLKEYKRSMLSAAHNWSYTPKCANETPPVSRPVWLRGCGSFVASLPKLDAA